MKPWILVDTGPLVAILNKRDSKHSICCKELSKLEPPLLTTWPVITEAAWLLRSQPDLVRKLVQSLEDGFLRLAWLDESDVAGLVDIMTRYSDASFQLADVSLMYVGERQDISVVFTLDRRDFSVFRKTTGEAVSIIPEQN